MPTILASIISGAWPLLLAAAVFVIGYGQGQDKAKADRAARLGAVIAGRDGVEHND